VIEFKYYSNTELKKSKTTIENWKLRQKDTQQIAGYVEGLKQEFENSFSDIKGKLNLDGLDFDLDIVN